MIDVGTFQGARLLRDFRIVSLQFLDEPLVDALHRPALARTEIIGKDLFMTIRTGLSEKEHSISLYHEVLEAMTLAVPNPPEAVWEFNEGDFEKAAQGTYELLGFATPGNLNVMLHYYDFRE